MQLLGESLLTGLFVMAVVFAVLLLLWGLISLTTRVVSLLDKSK